MENKEAKTEIDVCKVTAIHGPKWEKVQLVIRKQTCQMAVNLGMTNPFFRLEEIEVVDYMGYTFILPPNRELMISLDEIRDLQKA